MTAMAVACGVFIVLLGLLSAGRSPTEVQSAIEITCLVGGLNLCFLAVVLARLRRLDRRLDSFEAAPPAAVAPPPTFPPIPPDEPVSIPVPAETEDGPLVRSPPEPRAPSASRFRPPSRWTPTPRPPAIPEPSAADRPGSAPVAPAPAVPEGVEPVAAPEAPPLATGTPGQDGRQR